MKTTAEMLADALAWVPPPGSDTKKAYLFDAGDVRDVRPLSGGRYEIDLQLASHWTDDYRWRGLESEFGPLQSCEMESSGCETCGYGSTYVAIMGPK